MLKSRAILLLILLLSALVVTAQDDGDKTLPGEGEAAPEVSTSNTILDDENAIQTMLEQGDTEITLGVLAVEVDFSDDDDWEFYEDDTRFMMVEDDVYIAEVEGSNLIWGQNFTPFKDGVISIVVTQDGGADNTGFGVICRANPANNIDGYHFWISGNGEAAIIIHEQDDGMQFLVEWTENDAINTEGENVLHIVCVDEYLGFYVNGELVIETEDDTYEDGETGLSLRNFEEDETARAFFDDLHIWDASD